MAENNRFGGIILEKYSKPNILFESQVILFESQVVKNKSIIPIAGASLTALAVGGAVAGMLKKADPLREKRSIPLQKK